METRPEVLYVDKAFASAALYDLADNYGPLTGAANHSGTPFGAQSLHDAKPAHFPARALPFRRYCCAAAQDRDRSLI
jgi:hypothetical protein